jgi:hypothetical protein
MLNKRTCLSLFAGAILLLSSCSHNPLDVDVSKVNIQPIKVDRLEKDMFNLPADSMTTYLSRMQQRYGRFYNDFVTGFINDAGIHDSTYLASLKRFVSDKDMRFAYDTCEQAYPDMRFLEDGLTDAFKHYKYYFPDSNLPRVLTAVSGFNYDIIMFDNTLAVSLEMYLGAKSSLYNMLRYPHYKTARLNRSYMLRDALCGWLETVFKPNEDKNDFLSQIVHEGKVMYMMDALMPDVSDTIKIVYSNKQLKWVKENEFNLWAYIIQQKLLYSTNESDVKRFTDDGPFTSGFNRDFCPARTGTWLGWQIVRTYMKHNPSVTIPQLMAEKSADKILARSGYKPSK